MAAMASNQTKSTNDDVDGSEQVQSLPIASKQYYRIGEGAKGRGLFAVEDIPPLTPLHIAPCILVTEKEYEEHMRYTVLEHYLFNGSGGIKLLALGDGSLFNHSRRPNVDYRVASAHLQIRYQSGHRTIHKGEELCISYGSNLWFDDADGYEGEAGSTDEEADETGLACFLSRLEVDYNGQK